MLPPRSSHPTAGRPSSAATPAAVPFAIGGRKQVTGPEDCPSYSEGKGLLRDEDPWGCGGASVERAAQREQRLLSS